ncbi:MAG: hypothetical protein R3230_01210 [Nitrosopumilaceae archaeon]|nr:hypothetical protein [Nitrosopumilaceae archaeon]
MAQMKRVAWTNPSTAVARNESVGFEVSKVEIWDLTTPNRFEWTADMADASYFTLGTLAYTTSNGVTPLSQSTAMGATISGISAANPAVITVNDTSTFGYAAGDTIKVTEVADDLTGTSLNGDYTIASVTATTITTTTNTSSGYSAYVSGGKAIRESDTNGDPVAQENKAIQGVTLGTGCVGANSASMVAIFYGDNPVV